MTSRFKLLPMAAFAAATAPAQAQTVATEPPTPIPAECALSRPAQVMTSLKELPAVAAEFTRLGIAVADTGEPFVPFDVVDEASENLPHRQFVRAYVFSDRIIAWYFHGGFGTHIHAVELREQRDTGDTEPVLRVTGHNLSGPPCTATQALLDGVVSGGDW